MARALTTCLVGLSMLAAPSAAWAPPTARARGLVTRTRPSTSGGSFVVGSRHTAARRDVAVAVQLFPGMESVALPPTLTAGLSAAVLAGAGDLLAQQRQSKAAVSSGGDHLDYDASRGAAFALFGLCYTGIYQYYWFHWLGDHLAPMLPRDLPFAQSPKAVLSLSMTLVNQFVMIPLAYYPIVFTMTGQLANETPAETLARAKASIGGLLVRNWGFWIPTQSFIFQCVAPELQVPVLCAAGIVWNAILSALTANNPKRPQPRLAGQGDAPSAGRRE